jgi:hypothetical protein
VDPGIRMLLGLLDPGGYGSFSQRYGSGSFYHQAKIVRKTLIPTVDSYCYVTSFMTFYHRKVKMYPGTFKK